MQGEAVVAQQQEAIRVFTTEGVVFLDDLSEAERSLVGTHWNAVGRLLETGDEGPLSVLNYTYRAGSGGHPPTVGGHELEFDLDRIEAEAARGDVRFESIYEADR
jgi:hypothetical protein